MLISAAALDPIEKKPLAFYKPGSHILSIGSYGCTMHCPWCQNHEIAQSDTNKPCNGTELAPEKLVDLALAYKPQGNIGVAYTYNEPFLRWREVLECAQAVHEAGMDNIVVTNGLISEEHLQKLLPYIDALNIDLKGFDQNVYDITGGKLKTAMRAIEVAHETSHVEVTTLVIPGVNDALEDIERETRWLASIDPHIPLHLTRFFPQYKYSHKPPTPLSTLHELKAVADEHLTRVVLGNV